MSGEEAGSQSTLVDACFHAMEEVNEVARATGWRGDYRQLGKGPVTSQWRSVHLGPSSVVRHRLDNRVHVRVAPPEGCIALSVVPLPSYLVVDGADFGNDRVLMAGDAEAEFLVPQAASCDTLVVPESDFETRGRALFPRMSAKQRPIRLISCPSSGWAALHGEMASVLHEGSMSPEDLSVLFRRFLDLMAGGTEKDPRETCLGNGSTSRVARLAREYIEDRYAQPIRMEDVCRHTGVSLRTLQRSFSAYFQVSPLQYVKARRLNAARQRLVTSAPSCESVTRIARDTGFTHLGRFSVDYREHFGESPRDTLARRAPSNFSGAIARSGSMPHGRGPGSDPTDDAQPAKTTPSGS